MQLTCTLYVNTKISMVLTRAEFSLLHQPRQVRQIQNYSVLKNFPVSVSQFKNVFWLKIELAFFYVPSQLFTQNLQEAKSSHE